MIYIYNDRHLSATEVEQIMALNSHRAIFR